MGSSANLCVNFQVMLPVGRPPFISLDVGRMLSYFLYPLLLHVSLVHTPTLTAFAGLGVCLSFPLDAVVLPTVNSPDYEILCCKSFLY